MVTYKQFQLVQIGSKTPADFFCAHDGFIWKRKTWLSIEDQQASFWTRWGGSYPGVPGDPVEINSVNYGANTLMKVDSYDELYLVPSSFYFDVEDDTVYARFLDENPAWLYMARTNVGVVESYVTSIDDKENLSNIVFEPRLERTNNFSRADPLIPALMQFDAYSFSLRNPDGFLDDAYDKYLGQRADIFTAQIPADQAMTVDDFKLETFGNVHNVSFPNDEVVNIGVKDPRDIKRTVPNMSYNIIDFPELDYEGSLLIDKVLPMVWGQAYSAPCQPLFDTGDSELILPEYVYHITWATQDYLMQEIIQVVQYDENGEEVVTMAPESWTYDRVRGTLTITNPDDPAYIKSSKTNVMMTIESEPAIGRHSIELYRFLFTEFGPYPFVESFFDVTRIADIENGTGPYDAGPARREIVEYYVPVGGSKFSDLMELLLSSINCIVFPDRGRLSMDTLWGWDLRGERIFPDEYAIVPSINYDGEDIASILHGVHHFYGALEDATDEVSVKTYEKYVQDKYGIDRTHEEESILWPGVSEYYLEKKAEALAYGPPVVELQLTNPFSCNLFDIIPMHYYLHGRQRLSNREYRVIGLSRSQRRLTLREHKRIEVEI